MVEQTLGEAKLRLAKPGDDIGDKLLLRAEALLMLMGEIDRWGENIRGTDGSEERRSQDPFLPMVKHLSCLPNKGSKGTD
jgi:hypothetical protein